MPGDMSLTIMAIKQTAAMYGVELIGTWIVFFIYIAISAMKGGKFARIVTRIGIRDEIGVIAKHKTGGEIIATKALAGNLVDKKGKRIWSVNDDNDLIRIDKKMIAIGLGDYAHTISPRVAACARELKEIGISNLEDMGEEIMVLRYHDSQGNPLYRLEDVEIKDPETGEIKIEQEKVLGQWYPIPRSMMFFPVEERLEAIKKEIEFKDNPIEFIKAKLNKTDLKEKAKWEVTRIRDLIGLHELEDFTIKKTPESQEAIVEIEASKAAIAAKDDSKLNMKNVVMLIMILAMLAVVIRMFTEADKVSLEACQQLTSVAVQNAKSAAASTTLK